MRIAVGRRPRAILQLCMSLAGLYGQTSADALYNSGRLDSELRLSKQEMSNETFKVNYLG